MNADIDTHFFSLIYSLSSGAMQFLGKIPDPATNKIEINLAQAQISIDLLCMLRQKTKGNLTAKEDQFLANTIADLQLNYAAESSRK
jgi:hypothetical protein